MNLIFRVLEIGVFRGSRIIRVWAVLLINILSWRIVVVNNWIYFLLEFAELWVYLLLYFLHIIKLSFDIDLSLVNYYLLLSLLYCNIFFLFLLQHLCQPLSFITWLFDSLLYLEYLLIKLFSCELLFIRNLNVRCFQVVSLVSVRSNYTCTSFLLWINIGRILIIIRFVVMFYTRVRICNLPSRLSNCFRWSLHSTRESTLVLRWTFQTILLYLKSISSKLSFAHINPI